MKTKYIFALILVALLGLWTNKLKRFALLAPRGAEMTRLDLKTMDYGMYKRSHLEGDRDELLSTPKAKAYRLAGVGTFKKDEIGAKPRVKVETKAKTAAEKAKEKKKKKKAAKLARIRTDLNNQTIVYQENQRRQNRASSDESYSQTTSSGPIASAAANSQTEQDSKDLAEWTEKLLARADKELVTQFIREYQNGRVSEIVFYTIVDRMYAERSADFKSLAILAAGSVSTLRSFDFLVKALDDEGVSSIAIQAQNELQEYAALTAVSVLRQVFVTHLEDSTKIEIAVRALEVSTSHYLGSNRTPATSAKTQIYASFVAPLETVLSTYASNSAITEPGNKALELIKTVATTVAQNESTNN